MAKSANGSKAGPRNVVHHVKQIHGSAAPEPGRKRTADSGAGGTVRFSEKK